MPGLARLTSAAARHSWRLGLKLAWLLGLVCLAIVLGFTLYALKGVLPQRGDGG